MGTNTLPPIITIPITLIRMAIITIRTRKDTGARKDRWAEGAGDLEDIWEATVVRATVLMGTVVTAMGVSIEVRRLSASAKKSVGCCNLDEVILYCSP
jgi:hypothetical protein